LDGARSLKPGDGSRRNHIARVCDRRSNELFTDCVIRNRYSRHRCPIVSTLMRTRPPLCTSVYWTFVGHRPQSLF
jgi:hypothetical protein